MKMTFVRVLNLLKDWQELYITKDINDHITIKCLNREKGNSKTFYFDYLNVMANTEPDEIIAYMIERLIEEV